MAEEKKMPEVIEEELRPTPTIIAALVIAAVALNIVGGMVVQALGLPLFLDMIGTFFVAVALGPWWGCVAGIITNLVLGLLKGPTWIPFAICQIIGALISGYTVKLGWWKKWYLVIIPGILNNIGISISGALISVYVFGGFGGGVRDVIVAGFLQFGASLLQGAFYMRLLVNTPDKVLGSLIAWLILQRLPRRFKTYFAESLGV
jgi:energy-coupling factor transport system substrate-specific component